MEWYLKVLKNYANFEGRARRKEYWMFTLFNMLINFGIIAILIALTAITAEVELSVIAMILWGIFFLYIVGMIIPTLAVTVRRLHDTGNSGWMYLVSMIPFVGGIWLLILTITEGDQGRNQYGADPKIEDDDLNTWIAK